MPMGIVTPEEFELERRDSDVEYVRPEIRDYPNKGRAQGDVETPNPLRNIIADEVISNGRQSGLELASKFGISPSSVSAYTNGSTSTKSYDKRPNLEFLGKVRERVTKKASRKLLSALDNLTDDKLATAKAVDIASIAKHMSGIVKDMQPEIENADKPIQPQIVVFAPQIRNEEKYEMIFARE